MKPSEKLSLLAARRGWKPKEVAARTGLVYGNVTRYLDGTRGMDRVVLAKMAELFGVTVDWLLDEADEALPPDPDAIVLSEGERVVLRIVKALGLERAVDVLMAEALRPPAPAPEPAPPPGTGVKAIRHVTQPPRPEEADCPSEHEPHRKNHTAVERRR